MSATEVGWYPSSAKRVVAYVEQLRPPLLAPLGQTSRHGRNATNDP